MMIYDDYDDNDDAKITTIVNSKHTSTAAVTQTWAVSCVESTYPHVPFPSDLSHRMLHKLFLEEIRNNEFRKDHNNGCHGVRPNTSYSL